MNSRVVIKAENVSKQYRLGQVGTGTLSHDLKRWWAQARGKEDPYLKVGVQNDRTSKEKSEYAWALRNINFDVHQGDTLGIIGKNGAGKSTLLKLLSRVTSPTTGSIKIKGRIASLLEVGTGFHPELSGKENIFMNGAILGMTRKEITKKFDEIVDFAGVEMYIDTPVKRYSSGMYVRLAFGVAAHLESEILIVDEVLAVGDFEFQKKCLNKMGSISKNEGRTVLFVSHNLAAVASLCTKGVFLQYGQVKMTGGVNEVISAYLKKDDFTATVQWTIEEKDIAKKRKAYFKKIIFQSEYDDQIRMGQDIIFHLDIVLKEFIPAMQIKVNVYNGDEVLVSTLYSTDYPKVVEFAVGDNSTTVTLLKPNLLPGDYYDSFSILYNYGVDVYDMVNFAVKFNVVVNDVTGAGVPLLSDRGMMWFNADFSNKKLG
jgi:lipopolysaccharide transport system ATP-binding protein